MEIKTNLTDTICKLLLSFIRFGKRTEFLEGSGAIYAILFCGLILF